MRANSGESSFGALDDLSPAGAASVDIQDLRASEQPAGDTPAGTFSSEPVEQVNLADTPVTAHASDEAPSWDGAAPGPGLGGTPLADAAAIDTPSSDDYGHGLTTDGSFWFNDGSSVNDLTTAGGNANSAAGVFVSLDNSTTGSVPSVTVADLGANVNSWSTSSGSPDFAAAHFSDASVSDVSASDVIVGTATNTTSNVPSSIDTTSAATGPTPVTDALPNGSPSTAPAGAPVLAWAGDLGTFIGAPGESGAGAAGPGTGGVTTEGAAGASGLVIDVVWDSSVSHAPVGFTTAVDQVVSYYESHFSNPVTITIDVGYGEIAGQSLVAGALGESETALTSVSYAQLQSALVTNANAIGDTAAAASLPTTSPVAGGQYWLATAEAQALGLSGASAGVNGYVGFGSGYNFAYNDSAGVAAGQYDFFGVAAHEISEVMGRQMLDGDGATFYEPLDLFHYSAAGVRDFSGTTAGYFSANGGATNLGSFNTNPGGDFGDWAGSVGANSYLAYSGSGVVNPVTANDLTEMNILGWDPATAGTPPVVTINLVDDTGGTNNITSNDALTGSADANATVTLSEGTTVLGTTTANAIGRLVIHADWIGAGPADRDGERDQCRRADRFGVIDLHLRHRGAGGEDRAR